MLQVEVEKAYNWGYSNCTFGPQLAVRVCICVFIDLLIIKHVSTCRGGHTADVTVMWTEKSLDANVRELYYILWCIMNSMVMILVNALCWSIWLESKSC